MGNTSEFKRAVNLIIENVSFDTNNTVQVFEANIRFVFQLLKKKERSKILVVVKKYNNLLILTLFFLNYTGIQLFYKFLLLSFPFLSICNFFRI